MNGFMKRIVGGLLMVGGLASVGCAGGEHYRNLVDPCQMERFSAMARQSLVQSFTPQVENGHILDQTVWNYHFEPGSDKLHPGGMAKLDQLVQTRPQPDARVFLATSRDVTYKPEEAEKFGDLRRDLDNRRKLAIERYLAAQTADRRIPFEVVVHDPAPTGIPAVSTGTAILRQRLNYFGTLGTGAAGGGAIPGGGVGGASGYLQGAGQPGLQTGGQGGLQPGTQQSGGAPGGAPGTGGGSPPNQ